MCHSKKMSKKAIRFGADLTVTTTVHPIPTAQDEEREELWYNRQFFQDNMTKISTEEGESSCLSATSRRRRYNHVRSVLNMQAEVMDEMGGGIKDVTGLRAFAAALSKPDVQRARQRAALEATAAYDVYEETEWMKGRTAKDYVGCSASSLSSRRLLTSNTTNTSSTPLGKQLSFRTIRASNRA